MDMYLREGSRVLREGVLQLRGNGSQDAEVIVAVAEEQRVPEAVGVHAQQREELPLGDSVQQVVHVPDQATPQHHCNQFITL